MVAKCVARMQHRTAAACFSTWHSKAAKWSLGRRFAAQLRLHQAACCLRQWQAWVQEREVKRALLAACVQRMLHWRLLACLRLWRDRAAEWTGKRELLQAALHSMATCRLRAAWVVWRERTASWTSKRELLYACIQRMQHFRLRCSFSAWQARTVQQLEAKGKLLKCIGILRWSVTLALVCLVLVCLVLVAVGRAGDTFMLKMVPTLSTRACLSAGMGRWLGPGGSGGTSWSCAARSVPPFGRVCSA